VIDFGIEHRLEDDLAGLFRRERLDRQLLVAEVLGLQLRQVLELAVVAAGQARHRDVERVDVLVGGLGIDLDDERILALAAAAPPIGTRSKVTPSFGWIPRIP
jgi:hypothetical protein